MQSRLGTFHWQGFVIPGRASYRTKTSQGNSGSPVAWTVRTFQSGSASPLRHLPFTVWKRGESVDVMTCQGVAIGQPVVLHIRGQTASIGTICKVSQRSGRYGGEGCQYCEAIQHRQTHRLKA
jgi:hypothetical protein